MPQLKIPGLLSISDLDKTADAPISIALVLEDKLEQSTEGLDENTQNWLDQTEFKTKGISILRDNNGNISKVFAIIPEQTFFIAKDLPLSLPKATYKLDSTFLIKHIEKDKISDLLDNFAISWGLSAYQFERYKKSDSEPATLLLDESISEQKVASFVSSISLTRDLINTPASDMMPQDLAEIMISLADEFGAKFSQVCGDDLLDQNYPMVHAVGRASVHAPRLLELNWGSKEDPRISLVGKGVCFDSGGLNIKTGNFMRLMKKDMGGAAHVLGLARLIMSEKLPVNLQVLVPAVENAVSGDSFRPGDVIPTRKGLAVEIDNTDAEGRLVLCDALAAADEKDPELIVDFATLTGACRVALGTELPGFFCNDESVALDLFEAGQSTLDAVWRLPLHDAYNYMLKSQIADTVNSASGMGGAITAALYLKKFVSDDTSWVHYDVMAWNDRAQPGRKVGGEAMGLRATYEYLNQRFG